MIDDPMHEANSARWQSSNLPLIPGARKKSPHPPCQREGETGSSGLGIPLFPEQSLQDFRINQGLVEFNAHAGLHFSRHEESKQLKYIPAVAQSFFWVVDAQDINQGALDEDKYFFKTETVHPLECRSIPGRLGCFVQLGHPGSF